MPISNLLILCCSDVLFVCSDGFFDIKEQPKKVAVVGAGYIAVELAGIFHALGTEAHLFIRKERAMRSLDPLLSDILDLEVRSSAVVVVVVVVVWQRLTVPFGVQEVVVKCLLYF